MDNEHSQAGDAVTLCIADLQPVAGIADRYDDKIFALAGIEPAAAGCDELHVCCVHLRKVLDADTVYLCDKSSLRLITSSALNADGTIHEDTIDIHDTLTSIVTDLHRVTAPVWLPKLRVFSGVHKMSFLAVPVGAQLQSLAIIVDPDDSDGLIDTFYFTDALSALCNCYTKDEVAPVPARVEEEVYDELVCKHQVSDRIRQRRYELFCQTLAGITVQFETILEFNGTGESQVWGVEAIARCAQRNVFPAALYQVAELWGDRFRTALDIHILREAAYRYKTVCESEYLIRFDDIKPLCVAVRPNSLCQPEYVQLLHELMERVVINGPTLVLELTGSGEPQSAETHNALQAHVNSLRDTLGIRIALDEFGTGRESLQRFFTLEPEVVKMSQSILTGQSRHMALELLQHFSQLSQARSEHSLGLVMETGDRAANESTLGDSETTRDSHSGKPDEPVEPA